MLKTQCGHVEVGIPKDADSQEQKAEIYADFCCLIEGISLVLGQNTTAKILCDAIETVYGQELLGADTKTKDKEKGNK